MKTFKGMHDGGMTVTLGSMTYDPDRPPKILTRIRSVDAVNGGNEEGVKGLMSGREGERKEGEREEEGGRKEEGDTSKQIESAKTEECNRNITRRRSEEDDISEQRRYRREAREHARRRSEEIEQRNEKGPIWRLSEGGEGTERRGKKEGQRSERNSTQRRSQEDEETERRRRKDKKKEGKLRRSKEDEEAGYSRREGKLKKDKMTKRQRFEEVVNLITVFEPAGLFARRNIGDEVASYGIILVYEDETSFHYFACRRRATLEFAEMIKCGPRKVNLYEYLSSMTIGERELLCTHSHEDLWNDLLFETGHLFPETPKLVAELFEYYYTILPDLLSLTESDLEEPYYEFPKGRHSPSDGTLLATAVREMKEEVGIDIGNNVDLALPLPVVDRYVGTDGNAYVSNYFVIKTSTTFEPIATMLDEPNVFGEWYLSEDMAECKWIALRKGIVKKRSTQLCERLETLLLDIHAKLCGLC